jgi:Type II CAAX prenyl endopeptidase Rce1-like
VLIVSALGGGNEDQMISILSWLWIALLLIGQPLAALRGRRRVATNAVPRMRLYRGSAIGIGGIGVVTLILDLADDRRALGSVVRGRSVALVAWTLVTTLACALLWVGVQWARRLRWEVLDPGYVHLLPRTGSERLAFAGLALLAGFAEEYAVRGFSFWHLADATGSLPLAAAVTTAGFGLGHAYQGPTGILRTTLAGIILVVPVVFSGLLLPSMVGHAALDTLTGFGTLPLLVAWGLLPDDGGSGKPAA